MTTATEQRTFARFPETTVETKYGPLVVTANGAESLYIHTKNESGVRDFIEVRGVAYSVSAHLVLDQNGWRISGDTPSEQRTYLFLSRIPYGKDVTETARKAIQAIVLEVANGTDTAELRRGGRLATVNNDIQSLDKKIAEAAAALAEMENQRAALRAEEVVLKMEEAGQ